MGSFLAGYMTQYYHPRYSFLSYSFMGLVVSFIASYLTMNSERDESDEEQEGDFLSKLTENLKQIASAIIMPEILLTLLYFVLNGLLSPDFGDFSYYFMLNVAGISKFQYSLLGTIGQFTGVFGTLFYEQYLKTIEVRTILYWSTIISCFSAFASVVFSNRWNLAIGIPDIAWVIVTDTIFGVVSLAMNTLPTLALFAKITPHRIEGTIFAFLTGTLNLSNIVLSPMVGVAINERFVNVTADNLSGYHKLTFISFCMNFLTLPLLYMIPLKEDIEKWQEERKP